MNTENELGLLNEWHMFLFVKRELITSIMRRISSKRNEGIDYYFLIRYTNRRLKTLMETGLPNSESGCGGCGFGGGPPPKGG